MATGPAGAPAGSDDNLELLLDDEFDVVETPAASSPGGKKSFLGFGAGAGTSAATPIVIDDDVSSPDIGPATPLRAAGGGGGSGGDGGGGGGAAGGSAGAEPLLPSVVAKSEPCASAGRTGPSVSARRVVRELCTKFLTSLRRATALTALLAANRNNTAAAAAAASPPRPRRRRPAGGAAAVAVRAVTALSAISMLMVGAALWAAFTISRLKSELRAANEAAAALGQDLSAAREQCMVLQLAATGPPPPPPPPHHDKCVIC
ncbi:hypothetical protein PLESTF_000967000 [Pleodorina starrii]|nr:hypothetical protein PLESTF_000967000 [Pleodorina starrii]